MSNRHLSAKEDAQIEAKLKRKITLCGLNEKEIRRFVLNLEMLSHAVDEEDWERLEEQKEYERALNEISIVADKMTKAGCGAPPHGMTGPMEAYLNLKSDIQAKNLEGAHQDIKNLLFAIALDI